ncbi:MAG: hypothetical protein EPO61_15450 [Nitrospirae bacterium]|nr:MAG: hypothetical protein EPO61_15450 [Nitrospirota bacterium]
MMRTVSSDKELLLLDLLARTGCMTVEQVAATLPELTWCELFHMIDDLSRSGAIVLQRKGFAYELRSGLPATSPTK